MQDVERIARAICAADPDIRMGDAEGVVQQRVNVEWKNYTRQATTAISAMPDSFDRGWNAAIEAAAEVAANWDEMSPHASRAQAISQLKKDTAHPSPKPPIL
jgi:hypothetical protein